MSKNTSVKASATKRANAMRKQTEMQRQKVRAQKRMQWCERTQCESKRKGIEDKRYECEEQNRKKGGKRETAN
jgi:hypothetical protein